MWEVWKAPATFSGMTRALAGGSAAKAASCSSVPAATTWPPPLLLAAVSPCCCRLAASSSGSPPMTALMPVGVTALAAAMARPRSRTKTIACSALSAPATVAAVISPTECPAVAPTAPTRPGASPGWSNRPSRLTRPAPTISGWATAVSLIASASETVPWATRSSPATAESQPSRSRTPGSSSQGVRKPGVWEPCPGQTRTSTSPALPVPCDLVVTERHQQSGPDLEGSYKSDGVPDRTSTSLSREAERRHPRALGWASRPTARAIRTMLASRGWVRS